MGEKMGETLSPLVEQRVALAAVETRERIRHDQASPPAPIKRLLHHIEEHLLEPDLDVTGAKRACGIGDNSVAILFHSTVGRPPAAYIEDRRMEIAAKLLADPELKIWQVAQGLGYNSISAFSRAFLRCNRERPSSFRKRQLRPSGRNSGHQSAVNPAASLGRTRSAEFKELGIDELVHQLCPECRQRIDQLRYHHRMDASLAARLPTRARSEPPRRVFSHTTDDETDRYRAKLLWDELSRSPWEERHELVRNRLRLTSPSFFHFLRDKSHEVMREDLQEGVRVAELALASLAALDKAPLDEITRANLWAQGWTALGHVQCHANDFKAAEQSFTTAEGFLEKGGRDPLVEVELLCMKAVMHRDQRDFATAFALLDQARERCQPSSHPEMLAQILVRRSAVHFESGEPAATIPDLLEALRLLEDSPAVILKGTAYQALAAVYETLGRYQEAAETVPLARKWLLSAGGRLDAIRLRWLEGRLERGLGRYEMAEVALNEAHQAFLEAEDPWDAALVSLDLAELYALQQRGPELRSLSARLAPLFDSMLLHREALAALRIFRRALETDDVTASLIEETRQQVTRARVHPG